MGGPLALLAALWALGAAGDAALRIGAFNIRSFGDSKVSDPACSGIIAQILAGYDITLVQEVRDSDLSAVSALMELINRYGGVSRHEYSFVNSKPLGRDQYKETYLFKDTVSLVDTYQYLDPEDAFSREPFVVKFSAPGSAAEELVLIPLYAAPHQAVAEIDALYDVYLDVIDKWGTYDMLFLGDFNADCSYVQAQDWPAIRLRSSEVFKWLIPDSADTTVGNSDCAYDRIVVCGARLRSSLKPQSAAVYDFRRNLACTSTAVGGGGVKKAGPLQPAGWRRWDMWRASSLVSRQVGLRSCPQNLNSSRWYSPFKGAFLVASSSGALGWARTQQGGQWPAT
uniref:Deoxyribonuclease-1-like 2 n=1 Tax=Monodon monoceros TaxID=40151 RepID=A0A8C6B253_MONMO